jgi:hypothetical protein
MKMKLLFAALGVAGLLIGARTVCASDVDPAFESSDSLEAPVSSAPRTVLGGTNWLASIGVSNGTYSNLVTRLLAANSAITNALMLTNDALAGQALDEALGAYQDVSEGQLKAMQGKLAELATAYDAKSQKMEADERSSSLENARLYRHSAISFERLRDGYRLKATDIQSIRNDIQHNVEQFRQRRDYYVSIIQIHAGDQVLEAVSKVVEALRAVQGEIANTLGGPLDATAKN